MKRIQLLLFFVFGIGVTACSSKDSDFYNEIAITVPEIVTLENQNSYQINDTVWIQSNFSRYLQESNQTKLLDVYATTGEASGFIFPFFIEKKQTNGDWTFYALGTNLIEKKGISQEYSGYYVGTSVYNNAGEKYEFRSGIKLTEAGEYRLNFGYESIANRSVTLRSTSTAKQLFINIRSSVSALNSSGYYPFIVN
ncbi:MAG: hypothetical protein FGM16_10535 [Flavobacterium sp.]|nr:hypothetical protein [Flavobacterium sp.]